MTDEPANVVLVVLDTVRGLDTVPADGTLTPTVASLAAAGAEYRRAFASAPWTLPSHAGLLTGTYTSRHDTHGANPRLDEGLATLPEAFAGAGYETRALSNNTWIGDEFGFDRGFDTFRHVWRKPANAAVGAPPEERDDGWRTRATEDLRAEETTDLALDWLAGGREEPFFLFLNYIDAHFEYAPPAEYVADRLPEGCDCERAAEILEDPRAYDAGAVTLTDEERSVLRALYRGEIAYLDDTIGRLVEGLRAAGAWEDTLLVVTSDHGENVGDNGFVGHQYDLSDTLLHVPLVVAGGAFDDVFGGAVDEERLVQLTDLAPTLLDATGIDAPAAREQFQGRSFHPSSSAPEREHAFAELVAPRPAVETLERRYGDLPEALHAVDRALPLRAVRTDGHVLVLGSDGSRELHRVGGDPEAGDRPGETEAVRERDSVVERLEGELERWLDSFEERPSRSSTSISAESEERLEHLGYL